MTGSRPDGLLLPSSVSAIAVPPSSPGYHACRIAFACCFAQLSAIALPLITTTTSGLPVAFTASSSCCSSRGRSRLVRSPPLKPGWSTPFSSPSRSEVMPTTATTTSAARAAATARLSTSGCGGIHTSRVDANRRGTDSTRIA